VLSGKKSHWVPSADVDCRKQPASTLENLSRLASKPGVQSTLILSKTDGSIIRSTGSLATSKSLSSDSPEGKAGVEAGYNGDAAGTRQNGNVEDESTESKGSRAEDVAKLVFTFVSGAKVFADGVEAGDEVKLLRMRTMKNEIVIVPGAIHSSELWLLGLLSIEDTDADIFLRSKIPACCHY